MNLLTKLSLIPCILLLGCSPKSEIIYQTKYVEVEIPVRYILNKPDRPKYNYNDTVHSYLLKLIEYTKSLEVIIDENNKERL